MAARCLGLPLKDLGLLLAFILLALAAPPQVREMPEMAAGTWTWWILGALAVCWGGLALHQFFTERKQEGFADPARKVFWIAVLVTLVAASAVALLARLPFVLGANPKVVPGALSFVPLAWWVGIVALGLEAHLRAGAAAPPRAALFRDWQQFLLLLATAAVLFFRAGL
jgi:hypothetical protein